MQLWVTSLATLGPLSMVYRTVAHAHLAQTTIQYHPPRNVCQFGIDTQDQHLRNLGSVVTAFVPEMSMRKNVLVVIGPSIHGDAGNAR